MTNEAMILDPRVNAFRPDLADASLQVVVKAERYVEPMPRQCVRSVVPLLAEPKPDARRISEIRYGEFLKVVEERADGFAWVQNCSDHYVGYIKNDGALSEEIASLSNRIIVLHAFVYAEPDIKAPVLDRLTLGSFVRVGREVGNFIELANGGYIFARQVAPTELSIMPDYVFTAGRMLGVPYLWGGRTPLGLDCSGLVQLVLDMAGYEVPRDSDQQREAFGQPLPALWTDVVWKRGDIVFFSGHVGIMTGYDHIIHASAHDMFVVAEPLANVVERGNAIIAMGRP